MRDPLDVLYDRLTGPAVKPDYRGRRKTCVRCDNPFRDMRDAPPANSRRVCTACRSEPVAGAWGSNV